MDIEQKYNEWLTRATDEEILASLRQMKNDEDAKANAFYKDLEFGTAGLRGFIGAGTNSLNIYTIRKTTQGIANCMKKKGYKVATVSCDSRINSDLFARTVAEVFAKNGIKTYLTKELMPTPYLSYITREYKADIGVMITASHNPAKYNGYKVYGSDGCQLKDDDATEMISYVNAIDPFEVETASLDEYLTSGLVEYVSDEVTARYLDTVRSLTKNDAKGLKVTFSPLNGAGYKLVPEILRRMNVERLDIVTEQGYPDGNFTTCAYPNPEKAAALELGIKYAKENDSDILIATDPDCDRVGIAIKTEKGYELMTGNEVGVLLADYLLSTKKTDGTLPNRPVIVKTIVTTELLRRVAEEYDAEIFDVLTGFKYIGGVIAGLEAKNEEDRYILGFEESYGYLTGTYVRDKDAVNASMLIAEMTAYYKRNGKTLKDVLNGLYEKYGLYTHKLVTFDFPGAEGNAKMKNLLATLRNNLPNVLGGAKVVKTVDYLTQTESDLPKSNVLSFSMEDGSQLIIRPSGTEPLIKNYLTACFKTKEENDEKFDKMRAWLNETFK